MKHATWRRSAWIVTCAFLAIVGMTEPVSAQMARFGNQRRVTVPDYARWRIGPFYSGATFQQTVGYTYTRLSGTGWNYAETNGLGSIKEDGSELPLTSSLMLRNYWPVNPYVDVDLSVGVSYTYYPLGTQDDEFSLQNNMGAMGSFNQSLGINFMLTPFLIGQVYDSVSMGVGYVDDRGLNDQLTGQRYEYLQNIVGAELSWLMAPDKTLRLFGTRTDTIPIGDTLPEQRSIIYNFGPVYEQQVTETWKVGLQAAYTIWEFPKADRGDIFYQNYGGFTTLDLTEDTTVDANLGYGISSLSSAGYGETEGNTESVVGGVGIRSRLSKELSHGARYSRTLQRGFNAGTELYEHAGYWIGGTYERLTLRASTDYAWVTTEQTSLPGYETWINSLSGSYALTWFMNLDAMVAYQQYWNQVTADSDTSNLGPTSLYDYETWTERVGTSFLLSKRLTFSLYYEHWTRDGAVPELQMERDTLGALLSYTYEF